MGKLATGALLWAWLAQPACAAAPASAGPVDYLCVDAARPFFSCSGGTCAAARRGALPVSFKFPKPANLRRVMVAGESAAEILGPGGAVLPPVSRTEVINCGMGGYDSGRIAGVVGEALGYSPDLLVVLSGNNEELPEVCGGFRPALRRLRLRLLRAWHALRGARSPARSATLAAHKSALASMAASARRAGVPLVFCTLPANTADMPPRGGPLPLWSASFASGYAAYHAGRPREALGRFSASVEELPGEAAPLYYAALAARRLGLSVFAERYFSLAAEADPSLSRISRARNAAIREAAAEGGACLADLDGLFRRLAGGQPGFKEFLDGQHWRAVHNAAVWNEIFSAAARCGFASPGPAAAAPDAPELEARKRLSYAFSWMDGPALSEAALAQLEVLHREAPGLAARASMSAAGLRELLIENIWAAWSRAGVEEKFPLFLLHLAENQRRRARFGEALKLCGRALELKPADAEGLLLRAQALAGAGRPAEARALFMLLHSVPSAASRAAPLAAAHGLALPAWAGAPAPAGRRKEAKRLSEDAVRAFRAGETARALDLSAAALARDPADFTALMSVCLSTRARAESCLGAASAARASGPAGAVSAAKALTRAGELLRAEGLAGAADDALALSARAGLTWVDDSRERTELP